MREQKLTVHDKSLEHSINYYHVWLVEDDGIEWLKPNNFKEGDAL